MASGSGVGGLLKQQRERRGLRQVDVATSAALSLHSLRAYESGRRTPSRGTLNSLAAALSLSGHDKGLLMAELGDEADASPLIRAMREMRGEPAAWVDELATYPWVTLVMNERHQILGWNWLANAVAEMDLGVDLPTQFERNLLWMASLAHFEQRLTNWDELIGRLIGVLKREGVGLETPEGVPPYLQALIDALQKERPLALMRFFNLWLETPPFEEGTRNAHPVRWDLQDGTALRFVACQRDLSLYDGIFAFDWHAADAATTTWVEQTIERVGHGAELPGVRTIRETDLPRILRATREEMGLSRRAVAARAGVSEDAVFKYEKGRRVPARDSLVRLARALSLDGFELNALLQSWGHDPEPSDFARWLSGNDPRGIFAGRMELAGRTVRQLKDELQGLGWPCFLVNGRCEVEDSNASAARITGYRELPMQTGRAGPHLLEVMVSRRFREHLRNWGQAATAVLPRSLKPIVLGLSREKQDTEQQHLLRRLGREDPDALRAVVEAWESHPTPIAPRRIWTPIEWLDDSGEVLRFQCVINHWNAYDPYWAVDWHPANAAAWRAVGAVGQ